MGNSCLHRDEVVRSSGYIEVAHSQSVAVELRIISKRNSGNLWKKLLAFTMVTIMVAAGFVMLAPTLAPSHSKASPFNPEENKAGIAIGGARSVTYTISNMFESYLKQSDSTHSWQGENPGLNSWWVARGTYGDVTVRSQFPYVIGYTPYSSEVPPAGSGVPLMKYGLYTFFRTTINARNLTSIPATAQGFHDLGTSPGKEAVFFPILYRPWTTGLGLDGGWMNFSYYMTYTSVQEERALTSGSSWANSYYKVSGNQFNFQNANGDDGWYIEFQGKVDFNTAAAKKFLGLTGGNSLITQFNANNTGTNLGKLNRSLSENWTRDGSNSGFNDTYCSYDYSLDFSPLNFFISVDPSSTSTKLVLRIYGIVWGIEYLMTRYMDRTGLTSQFLTPPEDWYLNGTVAPTGADIFSRYVSVYSMLAWKDAGFYSPAWQMDLRHIDYTPNNPLHVATNGKWVSRYNQYMPSKSPPYKTYTEWSPGTLNYGKGVAYWYPPMNWNLANGERLIIRLPPSNEGVLGYMPYLGTGTQDYLSEAKIAELQAHSVWGEIGLGTLYPTTLRNTTYYDHTTKTLTITGPTAFPRNPNAAFPNLNATGSPYFEFDVMRVSSYQLAMQETGPYFPGQTYHLLITAKNVTGATVTDWNGTVNLTATAGTTLGASSILYGPGSNGVVSTTLTFLSNGSKTLTAADRYNSLDVFDSISVSVDRFRLSLTAGWNLVTVPLVDFGYKASTLGLATGDVILSWDPATQTYDHNYIKGISPSTADFAIAPNTGYWIWVAASKMLSLSGVIPTSVQIYTFTVPVTGGWIQIGFDSMKATWKASDITGSGTNPGMFTGPAGKYITLVTKYSGAYTSFIRGTPLNNFSLTPGAGYWCWAEASGSITYMP